MLINLESVERDYLSLNKSGVGEALRLVCEVVSNHLTRHMLHKSVETDLGPVYLQTAV